ncbi:hypothetical protein SRB17_39260 [Streptomyces sp. RB17]|uniref:hypothetical protein n=1 Tax=Streptomyces sp. RB17 TaxID=2585197 RepID=UPI00130985EF|nr:hypothetical protein [Streptomyces sp. RB17]
MPGTVLLLAASPLGRGRLVDAAGVLPVLAAVAPAVLSGTDTANVVELADPLEPQAVLTRLRAAAAAPGPLTLYIAGQLQLDRRQRLPHLALARTTAATVRYTGFPWHWIREELRLRSAVDTALVVDLHAEGEAWRYVAERGLECGAHAAVYGRVAPGGGRRGVAEPGYMKAVATLLRSGYRPPLPRLHEQALGRIAESSAGRDLVLTVPGGSAPRPPFSHPPTRLGRPEAQAPATPGTEQPPHAVTQVPAPFEATRASTAAEQVPAGVKRAPTALEQVQPGVEQSPPGVEQTSPGVEQSPPGVEQAPPGVEQVQPGVEQAPPGVEQSPPGVEQVQPGVEQSPPGVEQTSPATTNPDPYAVRRLPRAVGQVPGAGEQDPAGVEQVRLATDPDPYAVVRVPRAVGQFPYAGEQDPAGAQQVPRAGEQVPPATDPAPYAVRRVPRGGEQDPPATDPYAVRRVPRAGEQDPPGAQQVSPAADPRPRPRPYPAQRAAGAGRRDPHAVISAAVQDGRHGDADGLAAEQERLAVRDHGPASDEALHWAEVRADLAMFAGDAVRSCRAWLGVAGVRLAAGQAVDAPAVEAAVDRAHHQWGRIADAARARELGPALAELRLRVPGRRQGALENVRRQLRQLQAAR